MKSKKNITINFQNFIKKQAPAASLLYFVHLTKWVCRRVYKGLGLFKGCGGAEWQIGGACIFCAKGVNLILL